MALAALVPMILVLAAISRDPAGDDVERTSDVGLDEVADPLGVVVVAPLPKRAQAFFHLHWVHHRSRCSKP